MATIEQALHDYVSQAGSIVSLVNGRVYPLLAPQQVALPFIVYAEIAYHAEHTFLGATALKCSWFQWDCYGARHQEARAVGHALCTLLDGLRGVSQSGVDIRTVLVRERRTSLEDDGSGGQQMYYRVSIDTEVWYLLA